MTRTHSFFLSGIGALLFSSRAFALDFDSPDFSIGFFNTIFYSILIAAIGAAVFFYVQKQKTQDEARRWSEANERMSAILAASPDAYFRWDLAPDGTNLDSFCSRRLALLFGLFGGTSATFEDVLDAFQEDDSKKLVAAFKTLHSDGQAFQMVLLLKDANRRILAIGSRVVDSEGTPLADMLWVRDVTDGAVAVDELNQEKEVMSLELDRFRSGFDLAVIPLWIRDSDLSLMRCNMSYAQAVEASSPEDAVANGRELAPANMVREARALAARARAANESRTEIFHVVIDGARKELEITETPVRTKGRSDVMTFGMAIDATPREELKKLLERHSAAHADILEKLETPIAILTSDMRFSFFNMAFATLWGLDPEWLLTKPTYSGFLDALRESRTAPEVSDYRAYKEEQARILSNLVEPSEELLHLPDERTVRRSAFPHPFGGLLLTYEDLTTALSLKRMLKTSFTVYQETIDNLHEGVVIIAPDGRVRLFNPAYCKLWNFPPELLETQPHIFELVENCRGFFGNAMDWDDLSEKLRALFFERSSREARFEREDGAIIDFAKAPLTDGGILTIWLDVSDTAHVENALRERNEALSEANKLKNEFIANAGSEVARPLSTIKNYVELFSNGNLGPLTELQLNYARGVREAASRLETVFSDILDLAAIEAGNVSLSLNAVDIHAMLCSVLSLSQERIREKRIRIKFDCPLDIGWMVADERRIRQLLFHLLSNAISFTPEGGEIVLAGSRTRIDETESEISFVVSDSGPGVSKMEMEALFNSFMHNPLREKTGDEEMAKGLSLVNSFAQMHGGYIEVRSNPGDGTTFVIRLPSGNN